VPLQPLHVGSSALHQQAPQVLVAEFADPEQIASTAGAVLARHKPDRGGEVPAAAVMLGGIGEVVLVTLDEPLHKLGGDEFDLMIEVRQFARNEMGAGTGFHHDGASMERGKKLKELLAVHLPAKHCLAMPVLAMKVERMLAQVDSYQRHVFHDGLQK
jgi:hypothetical protein